MARPERTSRRERPSAPRSDSKPIKSVVGRAGGDPEWREAGESDVIEFSIAVPNGYGDDAPPPTWIQVTTWDRKPELQAFVEDQIYKGAAVAVEGTYSSNEGNDGKVYHKINAVRLGLVDWFQAEKKSEPARGSRKAADDEKPARRTSTRKQAEEDDDLDADLLF